jgi:large subunit ribosomal protein L18
MRIKTKRDRRHRISLRLRKRIAGTPERPRLAVFRSVSHIYAQVIDDQAGTTLVSASTTEPALKATLTDGAKGGNLAEAKAIDRGGFLYHGRVKAVADAAREAGLEF